MPADEGGASDAGASATAVEPESLPEMDPSSLMVRSSSGFPALRRSRLHSVTDKTTCRHDFALVCRAFDDWVSVRADLVDAGKSPRRVLAAFVGILPAESQLGIGDHGSGAKNAGEGRSFTLWATSALAEWRCFGDGMDLIFRMAAVLAFKLVTWHKCECGKSVEENPAFSADDY